MMTGRKLAGCMEEQLPEITKKDKQEAQEMDFPLATGR
jgi:hypothetical protein